MRGNGGVGLVLCKSTVQEIAAWDLGKVESIPFEVLSKGETRDWENFPLYMAAAVKRSMGIHVGVLAPLTSNRLVWCRHHLASVLEPSFQLGVGCAGTSLSWAAVYVGLQLFAFNLLQLSIFHCYDFVSLYAFRLVYSLHWHIVWGYLCLPWLF